MKIGVRIDGDLDSVVSEILQAAEGAVTRGVFAAGLAYMTTGGDRFAALGLAPPCPCCSAGRLPAIRHFLSCGQYRLDQGARYPSRF